MRVREQSEDRLIVGFVPIGPWALSVIAGVAFIAFAIADPIDISLSAQWVFAGLGLLAPLAIFASHAAVTTTFDRPSGIVTLRQTRPIGGTREREIPLARIAGVEEVIRTDTNKTDHHRIELILAPQAAGSGVQGAQRERVALSTAPIAMDQSETTEAIAAWLGVPATSKRQR
ncbi:MAG: hypothetical protein AAF675_11865 [Pseudomonadota bacterium]